MRFPNWLKPVTHGLLANPKPPLLDSVPPTIARYHDFHRSLESLPWVHNGLPRPNERMILRLLLNIAAATPAAAEELLDHPFLQTPEPHDVYALTALHSMTRKSPENLHRLLHHPSLPHGITDELAPVVACADAAFLQNPRSLDRLLDTQRTTVSNSSFTSPGRPAEPISVSVIRQQPAGTDVNRLVAEIVATLETISRIPFPANHLSIIFADIGDAPQAAYNRISHIAVRPQYDADDGSPEASQLTRVIAHEISHHYWNSSQHWIDEGMAELYAIVINNALNKTGLRVSNPPCPHHRSISQLPHQDDVASAFAHPGAYPLGERLFLELLLRLGTHDFREATRRLYYESRKPDQTPGIEELRQAFDEFPEAETIINRWWDNSAPYDHSAIDLRPPTGQIRQLEATVAATHLSLTPNGNPVDSFHQSHRKPVWTNLTLRLKPGTRPVPVNLTYETFYEDGHPVSRDAITLHPHPRQQPAEIVQSATVGNDDTPWAPGKYWTFVRTSNRDKIAQFHWTVTT